MKNILWLILLAVTIVSCAGKRMIEAAAVTLPPAGAVKPAVLTVDSGKVYCDYALHIGSREFNKNMVLKITPKLVYTGGELVDSAIYLQGQQVVLSDHRVVRYKDGIDTVYRLTFDYKPDVKDMKFVATMNASGCGKEWWSADRVQAVTTSAETDVKPAPVKISGEAGREMSGEIRNVLMFERAKTTFASKQTDFVYTRENLDKVLATPGAVLTRMEIVVSCSPEGGMALNENLAKERYAVAKEYVTNYFDLEHISFFHQPDFLNYRLIYENWDGLYDLIEDSQLPGKYQMIARMKQANNQERDRILWELMGEYPIIANEYLPLLRRADFIIYYDEPYQKPIPVILPPIGDDYPPLPVEGDRK